MIVQDDDGFADGSHRETSSLGPRRSGRSRGGQHAKRNTDLHDGGRHAYSSIHLKSNHYHSRPFSGVSKGSSPEQKASHLIKVNSDMANAPFFD